MSQREIYDFPSFAGEHPYVGILLVPWNYSPCILVAASWCLTHTTPITKNYLEQMSMQNPSKVAAGFINTSNYNAIKSQISLGIKAVFHPNPLVAFVLIKVIPEFQRTLFVRYQQLKYNETVLVNEDCDSIYWSLVKHDMGEGNFFYEYLLMNQIPCPYGYCHYLNILNTTECSILNMSKKNEISATILCDDHFMGFAEFGCGDDPGSILYHKITDETITWLKQQILL